MARELYPHTHDTGTDFDSEFEAVNIVEQHSRSNPSEVLQLHDRLVRSFPKAFAGCSPFAPRNDQREDEVRMR